MLVHTEHTEADTKVLHNNHEVAAVVSITRTTIRRTSACFISISANKALYIEDDDKQEMHSSVTEQIRRLSKSLSDQGSNFTTGEKATC